MLKIHTRHLYNHAALVVLFLAKLLDFDHPNDEYEYHMLWESPRAHSKASTHLVTRAWDQRRSESHFPYYILLTRLARRMGGRCVGVLVSHKRVSFADLILPSQTP